MFFTVLLNKMHFTFSIYNLIEIIAAFQGFIFAVLLIIRAKKQERYSDYWLGLLLIAISTYMLRYAMADIVPEEPNSFIIRLMSCSYTAVGVCIFFYFKTQINTRYRISRKDLVHFLPVFLYFSLFCINSIQIYLHNGKWERPLFFQIAAWFFYAYRAIGTSVYWYLSWQLYQNYRKWLPTERSDTEGIRFVWFKNFLITIGILIFSGISLNFVDVFIFTTPLWLDGFQGVLVAICIYYLSIEGYTYFQPKGLLYETPSKSAERTPIANQQTVMIAKMPPQEIEMWKNKILDLLQKEHLYLNPELTLTDFSQHLQTHGKLISGVINEVFEKNFNDFINEYRVNLFKEKVNDPKLQHLTILSIALECGFNSKSTFNRAVKKATGKMPSEFLA